MATTLSTMKNVVDITDTLVNRIKTLLDKRNKHNILSDKRSKRSPNSEYHEVMNRLRDTFLSNFPIRRQGGVGSVPFFYIAELNASLCRAVVQLGQLDSNDCTSSEHNKDASWGERISGYLSNAYLRETELQTKHDDNKDAPKSGIIALIQVMPNIISKVDAASFQKTLAAFTDFFRSSALNEPRVVPACLTTILQILKELSNGVYAGNFSSQHSIDGRNVVLVWTSVIPRLVWKLGKEEMKLMSPNVLKYYT